MKNDFKLLLLCLCILALITLARWGHYQIERFKKYEAFYNFYFEK